MSTVQHYRNVLNLNVPGDPRLVPVTGCRSFFYPYCEDVGSLLFKSVVRLSPGCTKEIVNSEVYFDGAPTVE